MRRDRRPKNFVQEPQTQLEVERDAAKVIARKRKAIQSKEVEAKRLAAQKAAEKQEAMFKQYDLDNDGKLSAVEMMEFVKGEYDFEFPLDKAEAILKQDAFQGLGGVPYAKFPHLKMLIGIARNEAMARKRKIEKEEKESAEAEAAARSKALAIEQTAQLLEGVKIVESAMSGIEAEVVKAEEKAKPLNQTKGRGMLPFDQLEDRAEEVEVAVDAARDFLAAAKDQASSMAGVPNDKLEPTVIPNCAPARQLFFRLEYMEKRLSLAAKTAKSARDRVLLQQKKLQLLRDAQEASANAVMMQRRQQQQQWQPQMNATMSMSTPAAPVGMLVPPPRMTAGAVPPPPADPSVNTSGAMPPAAPVHAAAVVSGTVVSDAIPPAPTMEASPAAVPPPAIPGAEASPT